MYINLFWAYVPYIDAIKIQKKISSAAESTIRYLRREQRNDILKVFRVLGQFNLQLGFDVALTSLLHWLNSSPYGLSKYYKYFIMKLKKYFRMECHNRFWSSIYSIYIFQKIALGYFPSFPLYVCSGVSGSL